MAEMLIPTGNGMKGKAKRWRTMEPAGKIAILGLVNGCQASGHAQAHPGWSTGRWSIDTDGLVTPPESCES
jgi:hypothetical protein